MHLTVSAKIITRIKATTKERFFKEFLTVMDDSSTN